MKKILRLGALMAAFGAVAKFMMGRRHSDEEEA